MTSVRRLCDTLGPIRACRVFIISALGVSTGLRRAARKCQGPASFLCCGRWLLAELEVVYSVCVCLGLLCLPCVQPGFIHSVHGGISWGGPPHHCTYHCTRHVSHCCCRQPERETRLPLSSSLTPSVYRGGRILAALIMVNTGLGVLSINCVCLYVEACLR